MGVDEESVLLGSRVGGVCLRLSDCCIRANTLGEGSFTTGVHPFTEVPVILAPLMSLCRHVVLGPGRRVTVPR